MGEGILLSLLCIELCAGVINEESPSEAGIESQNNLGWKDLWALSRP